MSNGNALERTTKEYRQNVELDNFPAQAWIHNPDLSAVQSLRSRYWKVVGDTVVAMSQAEKEARDAAEIAVYRANHKARIALDMDSLVQSRYPGALVSLITNIEVGASEAGKTNRQAYCAQLRTWLETVMGHAQTKKTAVDSLPTVELVEDTLLDTATLVTADPALTVDGALAIND